MLRCDWQKLLFGILASLLLANMLVTMPMLGHIQKVQAHYPDVSLSAMSKLTPSIDGVIGTLEWNEAAKSEFSMIGPEVVSGSISVMNDVANLYLSIEVSDKSVNGDEWLYVWFDNDHDGVHEAGEDMFQYQPSLPGFKTNFNSYVIPPGHMGWGPDSGAGGTEDGVMSTTTSQGLREFEFSYPLCSLDAQDFCLAQGDTVGFTVVYFTGVSINTWPTNYWPDSDANASGFGDITIASQTASTVDVSLMGLPLLVQAVFDPDITELPDGIVDLAVGKPTVAAVRIDISGQLPLTQIVQVKLFVDGTHVEDHEISVLKLNHQIGFAYIQFTPPTSPGIHQIHVTIDPNNLIHESDESNNTSTPKRFETKLTKPIKVVYIPTSWVGDSLPSPEEIGLMHLNGNDILSATYPSSISGIRGASYQEKVYPFQAFPVNGIITLYKMVNKLSTMADLVGADRAVGVVPKDWFKSHGISFIPIAPVGFGPKESGMTIGGVPIFVANGKGTLVESGYWGVVPHEIGHTYGLEHDGTTATEGGYWVKYGIPILSTPSFMNTKSGVYYPNFASSPDRPWWQIIAQNDWITKSNYLHLFQELRKFSNDPEAITVNGIIAPDGSVIFGDWYRFVSETVDDVSTDGEYKILFVDAGGNVLQSVGFGGEPNTYVAFSFLLPYPDGTQKIRLLKQDAILAEKSVSSGEPSIKLENPAGGDIVEKDSIYRTSWTSADPDLDQLTFSVLYSNNSGKNWSPLAVGLETQYYDWDTTGLAPNSSYKLRIIASDGVNSHEVISESFSVDAGIVSKLIVDPIKNIPWGLSIRINGKLIDSVTGKGIAGANIIFEGSGASKLSPTITDAKGRFSARGPSPFSASEGWSVIAHFVGGSTYAASDSQPRTYDTLKHSVKLIPSTNEGKLLTGKSITIRAELTDLDLKGVPIPNKLITFRGTGITSANLSSTFGFTGADGKMNISGTAPKTASKGWTYQAHFAGDELYTSKASPILSYETTRDSNRDTSRPTLKISSPTMGSTIVGSKTGAPIIITGTASDSGSGVQKVEVWLLKGINLYSHKLATPTSSGDWSSWSYNRTVTTSGTYFIIAKATDSAGNSRWSGIIVNVVLS